MRYANFAIVFLILLFSCKNNNDTDLKRLSKIYVDLKIAETSSINSDSLSVEKKKIFGKYQISEEEYRSKISSLPKEKEIWKKFFSFAQTYLDSLRHSSLSPRRERKENSQRTRGNTHKNAKNTKRNSEDSA